MKQIVIMFTSGERRVDATTAGSGYLAELIRADADVAASVVSMHLLLFLGKPLAMLSLQRCLRHVVGRTDAKRIQSRMPAFSLLGPHDPEGCPAY